MNDLINRYEAIETLARTMPRSYTPDGSHPADEEIFKAQEIYVDCIETLKILPSAQPEIVYCKECKKFVYDNFNIPYCYRDPGHKWNENDYCSKAERRNDG